MDAEGDSLLAVYVSEAADRGTSGVRGRERLGGRDIGIRSDLRGCVRAEG